jgi:hypothetical protein
MRQWSPFVKLRIGIESSSRLLFVSTDYPVFLTTSYIGLRVQTLKFWSLHRIAVGPGIGWVGFNWSLNAVASAALFDFRYGRAAEAPK